jgi:hypothetical protein
MQSVLISTLYTIYDHSISGPSWLLPLRAFMTGGPKPARHFEFFCRGGFVADHAKRNAAVKLL